MTIPILNDIVLAIVYQKNAVMRSSTFVLEFRKLSGDVRQWKGDWELTFERLPEIRHMQEAKRRVGADGYPGRYFRERYKTLISPYLLRA